MPLTPFDPSAREFQPVSYVSADGVTVTEPEATNSQSVDNAETEQEVNDVQEENDAVEEQSGPDSPEQTVRRSSRAPRPRAMFTYNSFGQPSYQPLMPGVNSVFQYVPYFMSSTGMPNLISPHTNYVPRPVVWSKSTENKGWIHDNPDTGQVL